MRIQDFWQGFYVFRGVGGRFADFTSFFFFKYPWKWNNLVSPRPNFSFSYDIKKRNQGGGGFKQNPRNPLSIRDCLGELSLTYKSSSWVQWFSEPSQYWRWNTHGLADESHLLSNSSRYNPNRFDKWRWSWNRWIKRHSLHMIMMSECSIYFTFCQSKQKHNWASSREKLSSGFPKKRVSNQSHQLQRLARKSLARLRVILLKKRITKAVIRLRGCAGWSAPVLVVNPWRQVFSRRGPVINPNPNPLFCNRICSRSLADDRHTTNLAISGILGENLRTMAWNYNAS